MTASDPSTRASNKAAAKAALERYGTREAAAKALGIARSTLSLRLATADTDEMQVSGEERNKSRARQLDAALAQASRDALSAANVREYIFELSAELGPPPDWVGGDTLVAPGPGTPTLFLSDLHWGEVIFPEKVFNANSYNIEIARTRLSYTVKKAVAILHQVLAHSAEHGDYPGIVLVLGGDMVSGSIHDDLTLTNERAEMPVAIDCATHLASAIKYLAKHFPYVHVVGVPGNHGRLTRRPYAKFYAETNFDWLIYQMIEKMWEFGGPDNVTFEFPPVRDITFTVAGRRYRLTHGDQFKGGDSMIGAIGPVTRGDKRKRASASTLPDQLNMYDTLIYGHFHHVDINSARIGNGCLKGYDEYSVQQGFDFEPPTQLLWTTHPVWGINYIVPIIADPGWKERKQ